MEFIEYPIVLRQTFDEDLGEDRMPAAAAIRDRLQSTRGQDRAGALDHEFFR